MIMKLANRIVHWIAGIDKHGRDIELCEEGTGSIKV